MLSEFFGRSRLKKRVRWVAESVNRSDEFARRAAVVAEELDGEELSSIPGLTSGGKIWALAFSKGLQGTQSWSSACFEILHKAQDRGVEPLLTFLTAGYSMPQSQAAAKLGLLVGEGVETERIAEAFVAAIPEWERDQVVGGMSGLALVAGRSGVLAEILLSLVDEWSAEGDRFAAMEVLEPLSSVAPEVAKEREPFLRSLLNEDGSGDTGEELNAISAATALRNLEPQDDEAKKVLEKWMETHPDPGIRQHLRELLTS